MRGFVIEFNRRTRSRRVRSFPNAREAMDYRLQCEQLRENDDIEVVALSSTSIDTLRRTHSRYFTGEDLTEVA